MDYFIESLQSDWQSFLEFAPRLFYALIVLIVFFIVARYVGKLVVNTLERSFRLKGQVHLLQYIVPWLISFVGILIALGNMGLQGIAASLLATGGVVAIVLGFAFRAIGENFLAGFFLAINRPFKIGDLIKTGDTTGHVQLIELSYVLIRTADACDVFVPSSQIFGQPLYNYTRDGLRRTSFKVGIAYHNDPDEVIALLEQVVRNVEGVLDHPKPLVAVSEFGSQYIVYEVFFWMDSNNNPRGFDATNTDVQVSCWRALRDAGMTFSTDVATGLEIRKAPTLDVNVAGGGDLRRKATR